MHVFLNFSALLFDMDGTLVDSTVVVERTWRRFARRHGIDASEVLADAHGRPTGETVLRFAPDGADVARETATLVAEEVEDIEGVVQVPGAAEFLRHVPESRMAVVTSASRELAVRRMEAAGIPLPNVLVTADDISSGKPDPEGYLKAAELLGVPPSSTVVFEDAESGLLAAEAAGTTPVVVGSHDRASAAGRIGIRDFHAISVAGFDEDGRVGISFE
ncbi:sugar-phosphatase [Actinopolyspora alba]|uniref:Sugar-phosphatase n=1 Tax=Actinopolyspora alba TaxID=673379 RepID=A0A1I1Z4B6_9ACTN|nr:HAD-IA family hydrolase [Actinopolyspora alba]SFE26078.1 sugar-phosphatase [Actinopolyspora alba]